jgi:hypothetical protein
MKVQVLKDNCWEWVFCRSENNTPVITKDKRKALKGKDALEYCKKNMANHVFRLSDL